jgi:hypothetical protein
VFDNPRVRYVKLDMTCDIQPSVNITIQYLLDLGLQRSKFFSLQNILISRIIPIKDESSDAAQFI